MTKGGICIKIKKNLVKTLLHKIDKYHFINLYFFFTKQKSSSTMISISTGPFLQFETVIGMLVFLDLLSRINSTSSSLRSLFSNLLL